MHETIVNVIVSNAFNGFGDTGGSDDFGKSFAWIDLADYMDDYDNDYGDDTEVVSAAAIAYTGSRWAIAYIDADGSRSVDGFDSQEEMWTAFHALDAEYNAFMGEEAEED